MVSQILNETYIHESVQRLTAASTTVIHYAEWFLSLGHWKAYKPVYRFPLIIITRDGGRSCSWCMKEEQNMKQHDGSERTWNSTTFICLSGSIKCTNTITNLPTITFKLLLHVNNRNINSGIGASRLILYRFNVRVILLKV